MGDISKILRTPAHTPRTTLTDTPTPRRRFHHGPEFVEGAIVVCTVADKEVRVSRLPKNANNIYAEAATAVAARPILHKRDGLACPNEPSRYEPSPQRVPPPNSTSKVPSNAAGAVTRKALTICGSALRRRTHRKTSLLVPPATITTSTSRGSILRMPFRVATYVGK